MITIKESRLRLEKCGIKPSVQRLTVLNFVENHLVHPTVDDIFLHLQPRIPTLSKTTVYNTLSLLEQHGLVKSLSIDEKSVRYDGNMMNHAHFICVKCHEIMDIPEINIGFSDVLDCEVREVQVLLKGICKKCKNQCLTN